ncbi:general stress protein CsbD [Pseudomonas daroniae]|uniref:General stress protein CsbD n=1 Tax=Phytopseudomonas daroniae TaxID=2487519 RepID=A0A4Q9QK20_9GAMM|nr:MULTISPECIES: CsbD family protein [Pseudomonas]TBU74011.1 general stress protein CsbD [Pseudomonas daroniae]TBU77901.1 general stress protein CsbD [Pseudomonas daroniae]TBU82248.1 general stress protein CsbD [Pseudomonas sp. FRB 228]TBU91124.1 general stress protein CsbD [Pseudomonas daroniae]
MDRPLTEIIKGKWRLLAGLAQIVWDELTLDELLKSDGDLDKLTHLVQKRYDMTHDQAHKQIVSFFERHRTT